MDLDLKLVVEESMLLAIELRRLRPSALDDKSGN
jgi:hypothetical protein